MTTGDENEHFGTLDDLMGWVQNAISRLRHAGVKGRRKREVRDLYEDLLMDTGREEHHINTWRNLAKKVAALLGETPPATAKAKHHRKQQAARPPRTLPPPARPPAPPRKRRAARPKRESLEMNPQLEAAFNAVAMGKPIIFVTGGAGTGKSTFIHELRARFPKRNSIVLAPTGVAALNVGGQTIHSFCKLPLHPISAEDIRGVEDDVVLEHLDLLIVDEISMVRADVFDGLELFLRKSRKSTLPFGGVQIVLVGDLFQLLPVVTPRDEPFLTGRYPTPHFFSAMSLRGLKFVPVELQIVYRQRDPTFAGLLRKLREREDVRQVLAEINKDCVGRPLSGQHLILVPTRKAAAAENDRRLAELPGEAFTFEAAVEGTFATGDDDRLPAPRHLVLKKGAQLMFVRNDPEKRWVNGSLGINAEVRSDLIRVRLENGETHKVEPVEWQNIRYAWDEEEKRIVEEILGTFVQYPLMPAWSVTIHKAQGLTLSRVMVDFGRGAFAEGQVYVALSRCQTMEGLSLARPVSAYEARASEAAAAFYAKMRQRRRAP